jgi:hypothetical protein
LLIIDILDIPEMKKRLKINGVGLNVSEFYLEYLQSIFQYIFGLELDLQMLQRG